MSIFQIVAEAEKQNGGSQKNLPLAENENPAIMSNKKHEMDQATNRRKGCEGHLIDICV